MLELSVSKVGRISRGKDTKKGYSHREIPFALSGDLSQGSLFWVNILSSRFYFWFGWFVFVVCLFFKLTGLKKTGIQGMYIMMGKNQR